MSACLRKIKKIIKLFIHPIEFLFIKTRFRPETIIFAARFPLYDVIASGFNKPVADKVKVAKQRSRSSMDRIPACRQAGKFPKLLIQVQEIESSKSRNKMITVYAILSEVNGDIYVGMSKNADKRLKEHNSGKNRYTKGLRPWKILYRELQPDWKAARKREKYLKSGVGKEFLKSLAP